MNFLKNFNRRDILRKETILEQLYIRLHNQEFRSSKTTNYSPLRRYLPSLLHHSGSKLVHVATRDSQFMKFEWKEIFCQWLKTDLASHCIRLLEKFVASSTGEGLQLNWRRTIYHGRLVIGVLDIK